MQTGLILKIEDYEGPIHLLLEMFKSSKLEITTLNIDIVLDQYVDYINCCQKEEILVAANYLDLAAEIVLYKSKKILKLSDEKEEEVEEVLDKEELINKILEYKSYKEASKDMDILKSQRGLFLTKSMDNVDEYVENTLQPIAYEKFLEVINKTLKEVKSQKQEQKVMVKSDLNVSDYIEKLAVYERIDFLKFFKDLSVKEKVISFLAILTLLKKQQYDIINIDDNFILIRRENERTEEKSSIDANA